MDAAVADADTIAAADPPPTRVQPLLSTASGASGSEALVLAYVLLALPLCPHLRACIGRTRIAGSMPCFAEWWICCAGTALWQPMTSARRLSLGFSGLVCHRSSACVRVVRNGPKSLRVYRRQYGSCSGHARCGNQAWCLSRCGSYTAQCSAIIS
eukprot:SAG25_NODE_233_length_11359_cov_14.674600_4_plen_155_part_00